MSNQFKVTFGGILDSEYGHGEGLLRDGRQGFAVRGIIPHLIFWSSCNILDAAMSMRKIGVLLVDDHTVVRQGLRALLSAEEDLEVIGEAENGRQAVMMAKKTPPDVVVMDVAMPLLNGLEATRQILKSVPRAKVLVLTS